jgi:DNA modification methylase
MVHQHAAFVRRAALGGASEVAFQRDIRSAVTLRNSHHAPVPSRNPLSEVTASDSPSQAGILRGHVGAPGLAATSRISVSLSPQEYSGLRTLAVSGQRSLGWVMRYALQRLLEGQTAQLDLPFNLTPSRTWSGTATSTSQAVERLANVDWRGLRRRTSGTIHSLHPYPTRFAPGLPAKFIEILSAPGETVLDPFCGSGTTLVEAIRLGRRAIGVDLSPLAILISRVKTTKISANDQKAVRAAVAYASSLVSNLYQHSADYVESSGSPEGLLADCCSRSGVDALARVPAFAAIQELSRWFAWHVLAEVFLIRTAIEQCPLAPAKDLLTVALSSILLRVSHQKSDTRRTKVARETKPRETLHLWRRKVVDLQDLLAREQESLAWPPVEVCEGDARSLDFLQPGIADLVVTSPPYPNAHDYGVSQRLRLLALGFQRTRAATTDVGSPRRFWCRNRNSFRSLFKAEIGSVLTSLRRALKPSGVCAFVVGPSRIRGEEEDNASSVETAASETGFRVLTSFGTGGPSTTASLHKNRASAGAGEKIVVMQAE